MARFCQSWLEVQQFDGVGGAKSFGVDAWTAACFHDFAVIRIFTFSRFHYHVQYRTSMNIIGFET